MARHLPGTRSLKVLEAAGRHLNFTVAASELGLTPAAISHRIKAIEDQLGLPLFVRAGRSLRLTKAGSILYEATADTLSTLSDAVERARQTQGQERLRVTAPTSFAVRWLIPRLPRFAKMHPEADVHVEVSCAIRDFARDDVDIAVRLGTGQHPAFCAERLFDHVIFPVCGPDLLRSGSPLAVPADLHRHRLVEVDWKGQGVTWPDWAAWLAAAGIDRFEARPGLRYGETYFAIQTAIDEHGVALGDFALVADDLVAGRLVQPFTLAIGGPPGFAYFVMSPQQEDDRPLLSSFRKWVMDEADMTRLAMADFAASRYATTATA